MMNKSEKKILERAAKELGYQNTKELCEAIWQQKVKGAEELKPEDLTELCDIEIDASFPVVNQLVLLLKQTANPFYYRCDGMIVHNNEAGEQIISSILEEVLFGGDLNEG